jgi:drug/metabolite transporter (DMT)-like permease
MNATATASHQRWVYLVMLSLIWGSSYILIKKGLLGFGYIESATIRLVAAGVAFLPWGIFSVSRIPGRKIPWIVLSAMLGMFIPAYLFSLSQQHIASSVAGILIATTPVCTFSVSVFLFRQSYRSTQVIGMLTGLACCIALSVYQPSGASLSWNVYALAIVLAALCYGFNINIIKRYLSDVSSVQVSSVSVSVNGLVAFLFVYLPRHAEFNFAQAPAVSIGALLMLGIVGTALAQWLNTRLINVSSPLFASAITYLIPLIAMMWGVLDGENLHAIHFIAVGGILFSIYMIRREK